MPTPRNDIETPIADDAGYTAAPSLIDGWAHIPIPAELWMLRNTDGEGHDGGSWVLSIDAAREGDTYLTCFSEAEAVAAAAHQNDNYDLDCVPVRIK
jgi:hypothetical protein